MVMVRLKGVHTVTAKGKKYHYAWKGGPRLQGEPGSAEFVRSYHEAKEKSPTGKTLRAGVIRYRKSEEFKKLSDDTKRAYLSHLDAITKELGALSYAATQHPRFKSVIRKFRDLKAETPRSADMRVQVLSALLTWLCDSGEITLNLASGFPRLYHSDRAIIVWSPDEIEAVCKHLPESAARIVLMASFTALRQGDLLRMTRPMDKGDHLEVRASKTRRHTKKPAIIPLLPEARRVLDSAPKGMILLPNSRGKCYTSDGFRAVFRPACVKAGITDKHFHDLKGTAVTHFILAGLSDLEVAEIVNWSESNVAAVRRLYVDRGRIVQSAIHRLNKERADG